MCTTDFHSSLSVLSVTLPGGEEPVRTSTPALNIGDVLSSACELANARAAKILGVRADQHAALSITEFVEIFKENWDFVVATETLAKRMIVSLRGVTASQVSEAFLNRRIHAYLHPRPVHSSSHTTVPD